VVALSICDWCGVDRAVEHVRAEWNQRSGELGLLPPQGGVEPTEYAPLTCFKHKELGLDRETLFAKHGPLSRS